MTQPEAEAAAAAVQVKLPVFWVQNPAVWFAQAESQFALRGITRDSTKYHHVVSSLDNDSACRILDLLQVPPTTNMYKTIKARLSEAFMLSEFERAGKLLHFPDIGDEKPSELMDKMLALLGDHPPCFLFRRLFLEKLPEDIRAPLVQSGIEDCRELAKQANLLWSAKFVVASSLTRIKSPPITTTKKRVPFAVFRESFYQDGEGPCVFHAYHGKGARRCQAPCSFKQGNANAGRQ